MNLSFMSFSLMRDRMQQQIDADTLVRIAAENGLNSMDIMYYEFLLYGEQELRDALAKYGVHCGCIITGLPMFTGTEEEIRTALAPALKLAQDFGNRILMVVPGNYDEDEQKALAGMSRDEMMEKAVLGYRIAAEEAAPYGITIGFENTPHAMKPLSAAEDCLELLNKVPGLGLIFDTGNFRVADPACDEIEAYEKLKDRIVRVHLKDVVVGPFDSGEACVDGQMIRCVTSGSGIIPIRELIHLLQKDGYDGDLCVEYAAPEVLHGEEHIANAAVYCDYIRGCLAGEPLQAKYGRIEGIGKPVSRQFFGTANMPMLMGKDVNYLLDAALSYGLNSFDCARGYGAAENSLGNWMKERNNRDRVVVLSKCGNVDQEGNVLVNRAVIEKELAESLAALQTDYIDIYLLHRDDPKTPVSEFIDTLNEAQRAGKIRVFGVSNWTDTRIREANDYAAAHGLNGFSVSSPNFGLAEQVQDPWGGDCVTLTGPDNEEARAWYRSTQMPVIAYSSLARGLMAGKIKSTDEARVAELLDPFAVKGYASPENFMRLARCEELSAKKGCSVSQLAIAWMFTQGLNLFAAATTTKVSRIPEQVRALHVELTPEEAAWLNLEN